MQRKNLWEKDVLNIPIISSDKKKNIFRKQTKIYFEILKNIWHKAMESNGKEVEILSKLEVKSLSERALKRCKPMANISEELTRFRNKQCFYRINSGFDRKVVIRTTKRSQVSAKKCFAHSLIEWITGPIVDNKCCAPTERLTDWETWLSWAEACVSPPFLVSLSHTTERKDRPRYTKVA